MVVVGGEQSFISAHGYRDFSPWLFGLIAVGLWKGTALWCRVVMCGSWEGGEGVQGREGKKRERDRNSERHNRERRPLKSTSLGTCFQLGPTSSFPHTYQ